jgi:23S rRNA-/tRNA-specific pseudouridylate synthase
MRLDQAVADRFPDTSRRKARDLIAQHRVLVNERLVSIASREVAATDRVAIIDERADIPILKITDDFVAVDKPIGLAVQPMRERAQRSLLELLQAQLKRDDLRSHLYVVHRIDLPTSGVVLFARNQLAAAKLSKLFATEVLRKVYAAVVDPPLTKAETIDLPIEGRKAITVVTPIRDALVEAEIRTGRTHQIRRHLAAIGHAVVGDKRYGKGHGKRLMLHAWRIEHEDIGRIEAPLPSEFSQS